MTDEMKIMKAQQAYLTLCCSLDEDNWKYLKKEESYAVVYRETGNDLPMDCWLCIDAKRQLVRFLSTLPVDMKAADKMVEAAVACCIANSTVAYGGFDLDIATGKVHFRMTYAIKDGVVGKDFFRNMRSFATSVIDSYNDKFALLAQGKMKATDFFDV